MLRKDDIIQWIVMSGIKTLVSTCTDFFVLISKENMSDKISFFFIIIIFLSSSVATVFVKSAIFSVNVFSFKCLML